MKRMTYFVMALAMVLGLAQCKKEQPAPQSETQGVRITLNVENGGGRHAVDPSTGAVNYTDGDKIYVGNGSTYIGTLTRNSGVFTGNIEEQADGTKLYFYFLSVHIPEQELVSGETTNISISIEDQSSTLCVVSLGDATYHTDIDSYSCMLKNQCALVKLSLANEASRVVLAGRYGMARVGFASPGIYTDPGVYALRNITFHPTTPSTEKWAILLLQDATPGATVTVDGTEFTVDIPKIIRNGYVTNIAQIQNPATPVEPIIDLSTVTSNTTVGDGAILTGTLGHDVQISIAAGATVTLKGANINNNSKRESSNCAGITCLGSATINLYGGFINNINSSSDGYPGIQAGPSETTLTIQGTGSLNVQGGSNAAGIGGGYGIYCGNISLMGGTISACGGQNGAGIGSGIYGSCGNIDIHGDEITAQGGNGAAGIGSGEGGSCGNISIEGGSVTANGGYGAAGIGCGRYGGSCGNINIVGGNITACGGEGAQNIGTGDYSGDCGTITVPLPEGALSGLFSVSRFKQVRFSQGNLLSDGTFADNQYTYGDHFGSNSNYGPTNDWYALSADEWNYLFENSTFGFGTVNGIHGLIILPDNYTGTSIKPYMSNYIYATLPWDDNTYSGDAWTTMENNGVVFLPAAGYYTSGNLQHQSEQGRYWSSSFNQSLLFKGQNGSTYMRSVEVGEHALGLQMSVRLVRTN
ncbi:MAG: hypothetical protein J6T03_02235 [Bacteroidales bacterium]|nr:hypothetical protein [Bacteroidales bacterium]